MLLPAGSQHIHLVVITKVCLSSGKAEEDVRPVRVSDGQAWQNVSVSGLKRRMSPCLLKSLHGIHSITQPNEVCTWPVIISS